MKKPFVYKTPNLALLCSIFSKIFSPFLEMGFPCYTIPIIYHLAPIKTLQDYIFNHLLGFIDFHKNYSADESAFQPSPSLVPLPVHLTSKSIKDHLPIVQHMTIKSRSTMKHENKEEEEDFDACCAVCLSRVEKWENVRELGNCEHVFHVECIDGWIDQGRGTCPVCRAKIFGGEKLRNGNYDHWRSERMVYLFGEDCVLEEIESYC